MVVDAMGQKWNVAPDKNCKIEVTGAGDASLLKPGMLVRFSADVDKKTGKASAPVTQVDITSPQNALAAEHPHNQPAAAGSRTAPEKTCTGRRGFRPGSRDRHTQSSIGQ